MITEQELLERHIGRDTPRNVICYLNDFIVFERIGDDHPQAYSCILQGGVSAVSIISCSLSYSLLPKAHQWDKGASIGASLVHIVKVGLRIVSNMFVF